ncbi:hypothetical protein PENSOL_c031G08819 [Penicillium solitum]|uniref:Uncharacterized protein n=1 Tax=Penicillium solitum TaxID=60172 RepID=A0A1V6QWX9_9EURO|nr:uncharacterized protein PENSOL_c031G08819 [Penicillium solitum]OQD93688.1 hypothetical protein PENSOL_c031G08819 [Penicillium solitum]
MSEKTKTPATMAPPAPSNSQKVIRAKEAEKALLVAAEAGSVTGTEELAAILPEIIKNIVEERRLDRKVENWSL